MGTHRRSGCAVYLYTFKVIGNIRRHVRVNRSAVPVDVEVVPLGDGGTDPYTSDPVGLVVLRTDELVLLMQIS